MDVVTSATSTNKKAKNVAERTLDSELGSGYGIFSGSRTRKAVLRFTPARVRWVSREEWHPEQGGRFDDDGYYVLSFPYSNDIELVMDILRYVPDVEVLKPDSLRQKVHDCLAEGLALYQQ